MAEWLVNKNPVLEPCVFTTGNSRLDTAIANIAAVSLNFWLIKLIFCNSKFTAFVILKEH